MEITRTTIGLVATVGIAAGSGLTYLALRSGTSVEPVVAAAPVVIDAPVEATLTAQPAAAAPVATASRPASPAAAPTRPRPPRPEAMVANARTAPAAAPAPTTPTPVQLPEPVPAGPETHPRASAPEEVPRPVEPSRPVYEELVVAADSVIGLELVTSLTTDDALVEDRVAARVTRDVRVADRLAVPAGARALGEVVLAEPGGRLRERARLGVRFTSITLPDGSELPIRTETIYREGDAPGRESATKIGGGAIGGAIIGGILGGAKGAAIGGSIGAGAGTAAVMSGGRNAAVLAAGSPLTVRLEEPLVVTVER